MQNEKESARCGVTVRLPQDLGDDPDSKASESSPCCTPVAIYEEMAPRKGGRKRKAPQVAKGDSSSSTSPNR
ncbi:hypothetical protein EYF80_056632 [Liparis tanakae]|uniref:Uncharacterized protein n=1 Tax=Liparis tanakae TaxID=230148 RepID=A0A4Z2EXZ5_9TELE|nr:hypothetical protein EYF80_056632 [Liparis tanakae]